MKTIKEILNSFFVLFFAMQLISCGQNEKSSRQDTINDMQGMDMGDKKTKQDTMPDMDMGDKKEKSELVNRPSATISLNDVIKPTNKFVLTSLPLTTLQQLTNKVDLQFYGIVNYNEKDAEIISSRVSGRIDKLYLKYRFESISKGEKLMEIYSPELVTAQQDLLFILNNDAGNNSLIESAKQKLLLLGMNEMQLNELIHKKTIKNTITIYSNYYGHIHESGEKASMNNMEPVMNTASEITQPLSLKEGMYVTKGQQLFMIYNPDNAWILANVFPEQQPYVHKGDVVYVSSGTDSSNLFSGKIDFIEPQYRDGNKTLTVRINFDNASLKFPIGGRVKVEEKNIAISGAWLATSSILSLGKDKVVFVKSGNGFVARKINVNYSTLEKSLVNGDFSSKDSVVLNAQYLIDSESFIKVK